MSQRGLNKGCVTCRNWQGHKYSKMALCNCYCAVVEPRLFSMQSPLDLMRFKLPFDSHDLKYFYPDSSIRKTLMTTYLPKGVMRIVRKEEDLRLIINKDGIVVGERVASQKIIYFYTSWDFKCELRRAS